MYREFSTKSSKINMTISEKTDVYIIQTALS